ncbi:tipN [Brevundimonas sp.]|uniref:tipN n=2 Tax=Brevundimonas sp. TaxID=1871086 RepID=UPI0040343E23
MKSRQRPPLNLSDPEPDAQPSGGTEAADAPAEAPVETPIEAPASGPAEVAPTPPERPMSERRRRRLMEEQRQAEQRADLEIAEPPADTPVATPVFARSAEAPPAPYVAAPALADGQPLAPPASPAPTLPQARITGAARHAYPLAGLASALWVGGVAALAAYEFGAAGSTVDPLRIAIYALLALAPVGLAILLAHAVRQGAGLAAETRRARDLAEALVAPTALAAQQTGQVLQTLRDDIDQASLAAQRAHTDMTLLRQALSEETTRLNDAAAVAGVTARKLAEQLAAERDEMQALGLHLDTQSSNVLDSVERQSRMIVDASDLAQTQLREAEAALAARAADLAAAAGEAQDAARLAADDLARQTLRLENAGSGVTEQIQSVEEGLGQQRAALVTAAYALRTDQEDFSAQVESQRAQLIAQLDASRTAAGALDETSTRSAETIRDLVEAATDQFRALVDMSQREADSFDAATKTALDRFEALAAEARDTLVEETRRALAAMQATAEQSRLESIDAANQAQLRADRLGEALFDASQKADQAAEDRIAGARRIVAQTADLVDAAGESAVERLERTMDRMTQALAEIESTVSQMDERAARLPEEARRRAAEVQTTVENGLAALAAASRKAAEDTEALDVAFQERVRRNYDMLTEAVRLMGVVSGDGAAARRREPALAPSDERPVRSRPPEPQEPGLRGRLRLEPSGDDFAMRPTPAAPRVPSTQTPPPATTAPTGPMGWNDLVGDDDAPAAGRAPREEPQAADAEAMADRITAAIRRMGVDPNALLPRSRVQEAADALADRDPERARQIVRRVAPAAVRSVSRRVISDPDLRTDSERYVRAYARLLDGHGRDRSAVLQALGSDGGRAFLLLDAAVGDLG